MYQKLWSCDVWFLRYGAGWTDRQKDKQKDTQTDGKSDRKMWVPMTNLPNNCCFIWLFRHRNTLFVNVVSKHQLLYYTKHLKIPSVWYFNSRSVLSDKIYSFLQAQSVYFCQLFNNSFPSQCHVGKKNFLCIIQICLYDNTNV